jgi:hypothetical protein
MAMEARLTEFTARLERLIPGGLSPAAYRVPDGTDSHRRIEYD